MYENDVIVEKLEWISLKNNLKLVKIGQRTFFRALEVELFKKRSFLSFFRLRTKFLNFLGRFMQFYSKLQNNSC
jgi:hypothetical protein